MEPSIIMLILPIVLSIISVSCSIYSLTRPKNRIRRDAAPHALDSYGFRANGCFTANGVACNNTGGAPGNADAGGHPNGHTFYTYRQNNHPHAQY